MKILNRMYLRAPMTLRARTASDLMRPNPTSMRSEATVSEAAAFLARRRISAAPVIDDAGRPVGVIGSSDILIHKGRRVYRTTSVANERACGFSVADVMTPTVFSVSLETEATKVVDQLLSLNVRHLFVVDEDGVLVGAINTFDVLRKLRQWGW